MRGGLSLAHLDKYQKTPVINFEIVMVDGVIEKVENPPINPYVKYADLDQQDIASINNLHRRNVYLTNYDEFKGVVVTVMPKRSHMAVCLAYNCIPDQMVVTGVAVNEGLQRAHFSFRKAF